MKTRHPDYNIWKKMRDRCNNPNSDHYKWYGAKGITVCDRWNSFDVFIADMGNRPSPKHSIDRIDNTKGYSPKNCRWATQEEQNKNRSYNHMISIDGVTLCAADHARKIGINRTAIYKRLLRGVNEKDAATVPKMYHSRQKLVSTPFAIPLLGTT